jgi:hypothetical protein
VPNQSALYDDLKISIVSAGAGAQNILLPFNFRSADGRKGYLSDGPLIQNP